MDYLQLVNKCIVESGSEMDELDYDNWDSAEAGRRIYPRIKRAVVEAWKFIQISRDEWEFNSKEMFSDVYPRLKFIDGYRTGGEPAPGDIYEGSDSNFRFSVKEVRTVEGSWEDGDAEGWIEFDQPISGSRVITGESFVEISPLPASGAFMYMEKGGYNFKDNDPTLREIQWNTAVASRDKMSPIPLFYVPWRNWVYKELSFVSGSSSVPTHFSQDYKGDIVFYPQTLDPFKVSFIYDRSPQILENPEDVPHGLDEEFHEWIAWEALKSFARYDKNPDLFAWAENHAKFYKKRVDKLSMPIPHWGSNSFNRGRW